MMRTTLVPANGMKPAKSPRYHRGSETDAYSAAVRSAAFHHATVYVYATYAGMQVTLRKPVLPPGQVLTAINATFQGEHYHATKTVTNHPPTE